MDIQPLYEEFSMSKYMNAAHRDENLLITIQTLRAKVTSADVLVEALREITKIANAPSFHYRNMAEKALATYDKISEE